MLNFIKKIFSIFSIFLIFNLTFVNSAQAGPVHTDENGDDMVQEVHATNSASDGVKPQDVLFNTDGTKMFVLQNRSTDSNSSGLKNDNEDRVNEFSLSTAFDVTSAGSVVAFIKVKAQDTAPRGLAFNTDGTKMFVLGDQNNSVNEYTLNAFDVSSASFVDSFSVNSQDGSPEGIAFNNDGTKMFVSGNANDGVYEYSLDAFDVSSASFVGKFAVDSQTGVPKVFLLMMMEPGCMW